MRTKGKASPKGGKRGCLCEDGKTYSTECCNGDLMAQGIGSETGEVESVVINTSESTTYVHTRG